MPAFSDQTDPTQQPWQERLLIFVLLCAMVFYLAKIVWRFRRQGLTVTRNVSEGEVAIPEDDDGYAEDHSD